jgi:hypothetical protein
LRTNVIIILFLLNAARYEIYSQYHYVLYLKQGLYR